MNLAAGTTVVDAHHHLWDPGRRSYPWMDGVALSPIRRRYGLDELRDVTAANAVDATVLVQTTSDFEESVEFCATAAASRGLIAGVVGWVDLTLGERVEAQIEQLRSAQGGDSLVGLRHQVENEADREWLTRPDVTAGIAAAGRAGLVYDLLVVTDQLRSATWLADRLDTVSFVLDHAGKPPLTGGADAWEAWRIGIAALAARPNVVCKLSGLATEADWSAWDAATLRPAAELVLELFGSERVMFGSDWPVCELAGTYAEIIVAACDLTVELSTVEQTLVFRENACRVYRLDAALAPGD